MMIVCNFRLVVLIIEMLTYTLLCHIINIMDNKKKKITSEQRAEIYANSKFHERTWFRLVMTYIIPMTMNKIIPEEIGYTYTSNTILCLIGIGLEIYFIRGKSRTSFGRKVQVSFGILCILINIAFIVAFPFIMDFYQSLADRIYVFQIVPNAICMHTSA